MMERGIEMSPRDVVDSMREYTSSEYKVNMDSVIITHSMIEDILGYILGLMVFFITTGMCIITALDICYITIPSFRIAVKNKLWDGTTSVKFRFISKDAVNAVERGDMEGNQPIKLYVMSRLKSYIFCAIILYIIIAGSNTIIPFMGKIVGAIIQVLRNIHLIP